MYKMQHIDDWEIIQKLLSLTSKVIHLLTADQAELLLIIVVNKCGKIEDHILKQHLVQDFIMMKMFSNREIISDIVLDIISRYLSVEEMREIDLRYCKKRYR